VVLGFSKDRNLGEVVAAFKTTGTTVQILLHCAVENILIATLAADASLKQN
jgi:hypothetical protein